MARKSLTVRAPSGEHRSVSVSSRKIDNGYIIREEHFGDGDYKSCERFSPTKPTFEVRSSAKSDQKGASRSRSSLGGAIGKLKE